MTTLMAGLADPVLESQRIFRAALEALSRPGLIRRLAGAPPAPAPLNAAAAALLLALADYETPVWLDPAAAGPEIRAHLRFHCGCPLAADAATAAFALVADASAMPPLAAFAQGSDQYPDRSATVIVQVPALTGGPCLTLRGPGIREAAILAPAGLPADFPRWLADNHAGFPCGVDVILAAGDQVAALPRSTRVEV